MTLQPPDTNATLYFTLDGSLPSTNSTRYIGPFTLTSSAVVTANAFEANYVDSVAASGTFTIVPPLYTIFAPSFLANGSFQMQYWAPTGQTYILQSSTDLVHWSPVNTNVPTFAPFTLSDPQVPPSALSLLSGPRAVRTRTVRNPSRARLDTATTRSAPVSGAATSEVQRSGFSRMCPNIRGLLRPGTAALLSGGSIKIRPPDGRTPGKPASCFLAAIVAIATIFIALAPRAMAQVDAGPSTNRSDTNAIAPTNKSPSLDQQARAYEQATEKIRTACVQGRRIVCGRIVKILPEGLVVDCGYTNLMRRPLNKSWLIPGTAQATREMNLVETKEPGSVFVGQVFLTDAPKSRSASPKVYDYVLIQGYPAGQYTYTSVGTLQRTVRRFSASLANAIRINRAAAGIQPPNVPRQ